MTTQSDAAKPGAERDLTIHQRNLVDTCFEENQYEAAISVLDEIRSSKSKPFPFSAPSHGPSLDEPMRFCVCIFLEAFGFNAPLLCTGKSNDQVYVDAVGFPR
ncbi:hypothetical protein C8Q73DRAFT_698780 [Cubamyces lactineus]|nr:hypothetical protein C8Q73DRAFT_698780 [Cubamyces lactineus]